MWCFCFWNIFTYFLIYSNLKKLVSTGLDSAAGIVEQIGSALLSSIRAGNTTAGADDGADTDNGFLWELGVPAGVLLSEGYVCLLFPTGV